MSTIFGPISLGELIAELERAIKDRPEDARPDDKPSIFFDWANYHPGTFHSYRGFYDHLAVTPAHDWETPTAEQFLERCKAELGAKHHGWKGGEYTMGMDTPVWVAHDGECFGTGVARVKNAGWAIILETETFE